MQHRMGHIVIKLTFSDLNLLGVHLTATSQDKSTITPKKESNK